MQVALTRMPALPCCLLVALAACVPHVGLETAPAVEATQWHPGAAEMAAPPGDAGSAPIGEAADLGTALGSAELGALLERAAAANPDVAVAGARIRQARALLGIARGAMLPVVSGTAGVAGTRTERTTGDPFDFSDAFAGLDVAFDLDLFGVGRSERRAAAQRLRATEFDREATLIAVRSDVARAYVQRATLARRIALLDRNIEQAGELERIIRLRVDAGETSRVDLGLQTIQVRELETDRHRLAEALDRTRTSLALLLGEESPRFDLAPASLDALVTPEIAPIPPAAIVHRPDIQAAEARIAAAGGDVDAARAAFYPRLRLTGSALGQAATLSGPLGSTFAIGADLLAPIFNRGRLRGNLEFAGGRQAESVALYRQTLLGAMVEVENALGAIARTRSREALLRQIVEEARLTARLARLQFMEGDADLQRLFDAEQRLVRAEDAHALTRQERLEAAIDLYRAMGGRTA
jgi:multidrug efflux system outer membrane protein